MLIAGFQSLTLTDFPGRTAAMVFTQGCNFQCPFCHNGDLLPMTAAPSRLVPEAHVFEVLARRSHLLDGLVISGGEPTLQPDLEAFILQVRSLGLTVKLDTNGSRPDVLRDLLGSGLLDFVAMDVKAPFGKYQELAGGVVTIPDIQESIGLIRESGVKFLFRTTWVKPLLHEGDIQEIKRTLGVETPHHSQQFVAEHALNGRLRHKEPVRELGLASSGLFCDWTASGCIDPQGTCFAVLASHKTARSPLRGRRADDGVLRKAPSF